MKADLDQSAEKPLLVLASQSQQRRMLLQQIGFDPVCLPADVDESMDRGESAEQLVRRLACLKADTCVNSAPLRNLACSHSYVVVLAADTVIELDDQVLGKPGDEEEAVNMLLQLSGRMHQVHSGVAVHNVTTGKSRHVQVTTVVQFATLSESTARRYWNTGEPAGKAGAYAIQGVGAQFVVHLSGSYSNVVGLPLYESVQLLDGAELRAI